MSGMTGGTASSGMRIAAPASQSSDSTVNRGGDAGLSPGFVTTGEDAGLSPGMGGRFIRTPSDPARVLDAGGAYAKSAGECAPKLHASVAVGRIARSCFMQTIALRVSEARRLGVAHAETGQCRWRPSAT